MQILFEVVKVEQNETQYHRVSIKNSFATKMPSIAAEWHPVKNGSLLPTQVSPSSCKKVWWIGKCGHEWEATIVNRASQRTGCPYCSGKKVLAGFNDLKTVNPTLAEEWHPNKNQVKPSEITANSSLTAWWLCSVCGHEWETQVGSRTRGAGCPACFSLKRTVQRGSLQEANPSLAAEWHPTKNHPLQPTHVTVGNSMKVWWLGKCGHEWEASVAQRACRKSGCPYCSGRKALAGFNDLKTINSALAAEWHPSRNEVKPSEITANSGLIVWWLCPACGQEWKARVESRNKGTGCPVCSVDNRYEKRLSNILATRGSLADNEPQIAAEWHPEKNHPLKPTQVLSKSNKKVWWLGKCGHEWEASIANRVVNKSGCPICNKDRTRKAKPSVYKD